MSFNYNHITLVGRLTRDPELVTDSDYTKTTFSIAVSRSYKKEDGTSDADFIPIVIWGKLAEVAKQYLTKGQPVLVEGRLQIRTYEKEGDKRRISEVSVDNLQFLGGFPTEKEAPQLPQEKKEKAPTTK